jgi:hypothetical protein
VRNALRDVTPERVANEKRELTGPPRDGFTPPPPERLGRGLLSTDVALNKGVRGVDPLGKRLGEAIAKTVIGNTTTLAGKTLSRLVPGVSAVAGTVFAVQDYQAARATQDRPDASTLEKALGWTKLGLSASSAALNIGGLFFPPLLIPGAVLGLSSLALGIGQELYARTGA